jgi:lincosamide nucleotidyltransferase A/C/D/E
MAADDLGRLLAELERAGIEVWLDGGWGVDALLGEQTREHDDLDLVVSLADVPKLIETLMRAEYELVDGEAPTSFVLLDNAGRQVDVHPVAFSDDGDGIYRMRTGDDWVYPSSGFAGRGRVLGRAVPCLDAETQLLCHEGYELGDDDYHDLSALHERFGIALPPEIAAWSRDAVRWPHTQPRPSSRR